MAGGAGDDECPDWPDQTEAGTCGCGFAPDARCDALAVGLRHRYSFTDANDPVADSIGSADGTLAGTPLVVDGSVTLSGNGDFVRLPAGLLADLVDATFEAWLTWDGGDGWQRVFEFGSVNAVQNPTSFFYLTPRTGGEGVTVQFKSPGVSTNSLSTTEQFPVEELTHVAVVLSGGQRLTLYLDGALLGSLATGFRLSLIDDQINRLGRSLYYPDDPDLDGSLTEFRIYGVALTATQVQKSFEIGPDAPLGQ